MRKDIEFKTEDGITLRGWHYLPEKRTGKVPTIVMAHGFSAVKEMHLDRFAEVFAAGGLGALVFDNRNFGASDGEPRQHIDPWEQVRDYRDAITFAGTLAEVDADRKARYAGQPRAMIPVVAQDPTAPCALPTPDSWQWFTETGKSRASAWRNEVTLQSVEMFTEYEPGAYIEWISPTVDDGGRRGRSLDGQRRGAGRLSASAGAQEADPAPGGPLRRLRQGLRGVERRRPRLVRPAPRYEVANRRRE